MAAPEREYWFRQWRPGRFEVIHWKGWLSALAFVPIAALGLTLETWLMRLGSVALYYAVMIPFGLLVVAGAACVAARIDRG